MAGQDTIVLRHLVWHDTCGGCHSSLTPSGLVALSRESIRGVSLLNVYFKMIRKSVRWRRRMKRSIDMTSDSGLISQESDYAGRIQEILNELRQMQQTPQLVTSPEALETLEREIRQRTDRLGSLLVGHHLQQALDAPALQAEQALLVSQWPKPLKSDGKVQVWVRTAQGHTMSVWVTYYRCKGQRRAGKRYAGVYAGLVLLGIHERCTPALAAEVSLLAAMLGSLQEAQDVLANGGVALDTKTIRLIAYR